MTHRLESILWSSIVALVMVFFLYLSYQLRFGAMYARVTIVACLIFALISLALSLPKKKAPAAPADYAPAPEGLEETSTPFLSLDVMMVMLVSFVSALAWERISFLYAGFLALMFLFLAKKQPPLKSLIVAAATVGVIQYVFGNIFQIPLPSPSWWSIYN